MTKKIDTQELVEKTVKTLLNLMGSTSSFTVALEEDVYVVNIEGGEETGLLIGRKGETLSSLQSVVSAIVRSELGEWQKIVLNVGDWKEKQDEKLKELAQQAAQRALETGEPQPIYNLTPAQRRVIHMELSENSEITTVSEGEGMERYLVVSPKTDKSDGSTQE